MEKQESRGPPEKAGIASEESRSVPEGSRDAAEESRGAPPKTLDIDLPATDLSLLCVDFTCLSYNVYK